MYLKPRRVLALAAATAICASSKAHAFTFSFASKPTQCGSTVVTVDGGKPPYRLVMVPSGPLQGRPEIRTIIDQQFTSSSFTLPPLNFPGGSNFTAVMGDSTGVGTGGTSLITDVANSSDESCLSTTETNPLFYIYLPQNPTLTQCGSIDIGFSDTAQGDITLIGLIPGGTSFSIPVPSGARSVTWNPITVAAGTGVLLVAGDSRGRGTGGSAYMLIVQNGSNSCLTSSGGGGGGASSSASVYSSTNSPYAGGQYATGSGGGTVTGPWQNGGNGQPGSSNSPSGGSSGPASNKTGIIVGVVCGVAALLAICICLFFLWRRRRTAKGRRYGGTKEVDLLKSDRVIGSEAGGHAFEPTPFYAPPAPLRTGNDTNNNSPARSGFSTPPLLPHSAGNTHRPSTSISTMNNGATGGGAYHSSESSHDPLVPPSSWNPAAMYNRPHTPSTDLGSNSNASEYAPASPVNPKHAEATGGSRLRPVNFIQHQDAGALPQQPTSAGAEQEVVELPPSYNDVRQGQTALGTNP